MSGGSHVQESGAVPRWTEKERLSKAREVRRARLALGLHQDEVAERAGVSRRTISNIESGKVIPQADVLWRVLGAVELRDDLRREWSEDVDGWLHIVGNILEQMDDKSRSRAVREMLVYITGPGASLGRTVRVSVEERPQEDPGSEAASA